MAWEDTDQNQRDAETAVADRRLREALEATSEAFILWDHQQRLVICNSKFQQLYHLSPEAVRVGTPYKDMGLGESPPHLPSTPVNLIDTGYIRSYEAQFEGERWMQINEQRTRDGGYVCVGTDITILKQKEAELQDSERRLMMIISDLRRSRHALEGQAERLSQLADKYLEQKAAAESANRTKIEFLANMSHEWRTPLNAIIGFAEMMEHQTLGPLGHSKYIDYCSHIKESGQYLLGAIADILDISRLEAGRVTLEKKHIALDPILRRVLMDNAELAEMKHIHFHKELVTGEYVYADSDALEQILHILLRNALKFTPEHGMVSLSFTRSDHHFSLEVRDTGFGIPIEMIEKIGRPFEQTGEVLENGMKGSGLGLAIAKSLVELHGGDLAISSAHRKGTLITVTFPYFSDVSAADTSVLAQEEHRV